MNICYCFFFVFNALMQMLLDADEKVYPFIKQGPLFKQ